MCHIHVAGIAAYTLLMLTSTPSPEGVSYAVAAVQNDFVLIITTFYAGSCCNVYAFVNEA